MNIFIRSFKIFISTFLLIIFLNSCKDGKLIGGDARKFPDDPKLRVKKNLEEGRGFRLSDSKILGQGSGVFEFASSNELWRASLDIIDFMPLSSVNYSGGIIVTDWYSDGQDTNESIKISIRFLTNEIRADALNIKIFYKKCTTAVSCKITEQEGNLKTELLKNILKQATIYEKQKKDKNFKPYSGSLSNIK
tara:strand:- start:4033 stop:4608 length:576 start_codon:yes stop_codon:yes gene_type:complete